IGAEVNAAGTVSTRILASADQFAVLNPATNGYTLPFFVQGSQTFIVSALIQDASIGSGKITNYLQSDDYVAGRAGMRIGFRTGSIEINGSNSLGMMKQDNVTISIANKSGQLKVQLGYLTGVF
ncbi:MAG: DUF1983 domain-containing protein, partial [Acinetobacter sp.]